MRIITKQLPQEVESCKGHIVYVVDDNNTAIEATICNLANLKANINKFIFKYKIHNTYI